MRQVTINVFYEPNGTCCEDVAELLKEVVERELEKDLQQNNITGSAFSVDAGAYCNTDQYGWCSECGRTVK